MIAVDFFKFRPRQGKVNEPTWELRQLMDSLTLQTKKMHERFK